MNQVSAQIYDVLPFWLRTVVASCYGYYLNSCRYGYHTEDAVRLALERDFWEPEQWASYRSAKLAEILQHAAKHVSYYRDEWASHDEEESTLGRRDLKQWRLLEKEDLRQQPRRFLADNVSRRTLYRESTSGTTGTPLTVWHSRSALRAWYALFEARCRRWYGISRHDRWAMVGGRLVVPAARKRPPFWVWNQAARQLYLSSYHLTTKNVTSYFEALLSYRVTYILGYPSSIAALAHEVLRKKRRDLRMKVVVCNAEPLLESQRRVISEAFQCPVRDTYGMAENVIGASECEAGTMHLWPEVGILEVMRDGEAVDSAAIGDFVATGLLDKGMPLIRYRVGDQGVLAKSSKVCACGRTLPIVESIAGRNYDLLYGLDGQPLSEIDPVPSQGVDVREAQIVQEKVDRVRVLCVPGKDFGQVDRGRIVAHVQSKMGPVEVLVEEVSALSRSANNKLHTVICKIRP